MTRASDVTDRTNVAVEFLEKLRPGGPWLLVAIEPDGATTTGKTCFTAAEVDEFVAGNDGVRNVYYSVNPTRQPMNKKAAKTDVARIEYILADLDAKDDETTEEAKARYLNQLNGAFAPRPTAVVDSGNGIQCLWRLQEPVDLAEPITVTDEEGKPEERFNLEDERKVAAVERCAATMMVHLGSKAGTQNIDRILRLPGTTNLPTAKKRKAGRVACPTRLVAFNGTSHTMEDFPSAGDDVADDHEAEASSDAAPDMPPRLASLLSVTGSGAYQSRSELVFAFITEAMRARVADGIIVRACLDQAHAGCGIYQHCIENGRRPYVERQIKQAREKIGEIRLEMLTDLGNARRLVRLYGRDIRYVYIWHKWMAWEDGCWCKDDGNGAVMRMAKATVEEMFAEAARINDEQRRKDMRSHALKSQKAERLTAMVKLANSELEVVLAVEKLDADSLILGVKNGVIDLRTGAFRQAQREDYVTKTASAAFDPQAECPNWIAFLDKIFKRDAKLIAYVQRSVGYILTGQTGEEVMFVLWGSGDNGKSTFRETIFALLGNYAIGADAGLLVTSKALHPRWRAFTGAVSSPSTRPKKATTSTSRG
jgi:hypothetical protein